MPMVLEYLCGSCGSTVRWVYEEGKLYPNKLRGCGGYNCIAVHQATIDELSREEIEDAGWINFDLDW